MNHSILSKVDFRDQNQVDQAAAEILKKMQEEKKTFHEIVGLSDSFLERLYALAYSFYNQGKFDQAYHYFQLLISMNPKNGKYFYGFGATLHQLKKYEEAASSFKMALYLDPSQLHAAYYAADAHLQLNETGDALEALEIAIELASNIKQHKEFKERCLLIKKTLESKKII